jgi:hypothetical protein
VHHSERPIKRGNIDAALEAGGCAACPIRNSSPSHLPRQNPFQAQLPTEHDRYRQCAARGRVLGQFRARAMLSFDGRLRPRVSFGAGFARCVQQRAHGDANDARAMAGRLLPGTIGRSRSCASSSASDGDAATGSSAKSVQFDPALRPAHMADFHHARYRRPPARARTGGRLTSACLPVSLLLTCLAPTATRGSAWSRRPCCSRASRWSRSGRAPRRWPWLPGRPGPGRAAR